MCWGRGACFSSGTGFCFFNGSVGILMTKAYLEEEEATWVVGMGMEQHRENPGFCWTSQNGIGCWDIPGWKHRTSPGALIFERSVLEITSLAWTGDFPQCLEGGSNEGVHPWSLAISLLGIAWNNKKQKETLLQSSVNCKFFPASRKGFDMPWCQRSI